VGSQPADSRNRLATVEPKAGISFPLQFKKLVAVCQFLLSAKSEKPIAVTKPIRELVFSRNAGKIISHER
jgi:hypothetical protein